MPQVIDIEREMEPLTFLEGRHADSSEDDLAAAFATLAVYRDGGIFAGGFSGMSDWERHSNGDEIVHVLDGATPITIVTASGPDPFALTDAGLNPSGCAPVRLDTPAAPLRVPAAAVPPARPFVPLEATEVRIEDEGP